MPELPPNSTHPLTREAWRAWLAAKHAGDEGVWFVYYKKATGKPQVAYGEAVEEALCFGWVDSRARKLDAERSMLWFAPRKPGSGWARSNKRRIERLLADGRMAPAGLAKIEAAKADDSWNALDDVENLVVPDDLCDAFAAHPPAAAHFEVFPRSVKRVILEWIASAKKPDTRARRIDETARLAAQNLRANPWRP